MTLSWGSELWDKFDECWKLTSDSTDKLETELKRFFKQRGDIEKDYVGKLNRLQKNFTPRSKSSDEEHSCTIVFKKILEELGYRTNQHSAIADNIENECMKEINERVREARAKLGSKKLSFKSREMSLTDATTVLMTASITTKSLTTTSRVLTRLSI